MGVGIVEGEEDEGIVVLIRFSGPRVYFSSSSSPSSVVSIYV